MDTPTWHGNTNGKFTTAAAYKAITQQEEHDLDWQWVWKIKVPQRMRSFLWLVMHGRLLTNQMRLRRQLTDSDTCSRCQTAREDMSHILRTCPKAKSVWIRLQSFTWWQEGACTPLPAWVRSNMACKQTVQDIQWPIVFLSALWNIWKDRNREVFDAQILPAAASTARIIHQAKEIQESHLNPIHPYYSTPRLTSWFAPLAGSLKLNTDGSSRGDPGQSGYGGLLRDEVGTWLWGYHGYLGSCSSLEAELWGLYRGLTIIMQKGLDNIELETDSQEAGQLISDGADSSCPYRALIEDANFLLRRCKCRISFIPREANKCADVLANVGANQTEHFVYLEEPPTVIHSELIADMVSASSRRD